MSFITIMQYYFTDRASWDKTLEQIIVSYDVFASVKNDFWQDYELLAPGLIPFITYNTPKPVTPLKNFFLPVKENVTNRASNPKKRIIIGIPNCDLEALKILDEIYLDKDYLDPFYLNKRNDTLLIASDCFGILEHCHCTAYGVKPYSDGNGDISAAAINGSILLSVFSEKGERFVQEFNITPKKIDPDSPVLKEINQKRMETVSMIEKSHQALPDYQTTGDLVKKSGEEIWKKYASQCVSCGACATICPTCSCFLLIDKPGFEKVKQLDACQYPGFERVAGGEDALGRLFVRFRNRYLCKYVWKPEKFKSIACTGCGRCIEACIGRINKNELFMELTN